MRGTCQAISSPQGMCIFKHLRAKDYIVRSQRQQEIGKRRAESTSLDTEADFDEVEGTLGSGADPPQEVPGGCESGSDHPPHPSDSHRKCLQYNPAMGLCKQKVIHGTFRTPPRLAMESTASTW